MEENRRTGAYPTAGIQLSLHTMPAVFRSLVLAVALTLVAAGPQRGRSVGNSGATITFATNPRYGRPHGRFNGPSGHAGGRGGANVQFGETSAISEQKSTGDGGQINQGQATGVSVQKQTGLGSATQTTNNQAVIQALQQAGGGGTGTGTSQQTSNNQVNINSNQLQQNVEGTLVNVHDGHMGVVIVNTNDGTGAVVEQQVINNKPIAPQTPDSARCRHVCIRPLNKAPYCCDDGSNTRGDPLAIHGGKCPAVRALCSRNTFFRKCAHDGQCALSDKCCYDKCADHHICKSADLF